MCSIRSKFVILHKYMLDENYFDHTRKKRKVETIAIPEPPPIPLPISKPIPIPNTRHNNTKLPELKYSRVFTFSEDDIILSKKGLLNISQRQYEIE